jgi:hypothetical protein
LFLAPEVGCTYTSWRPASFDVYANQRPSELFYRHGDQVLAVDVATNSTFEYRKPRKIFEGRYGLGDVKDDTRAYDVAPDGQRFLMLRPESQPSTGDLKVVVNWYDELQRLERTRE